jgi:hypothetical protein
MKKVSGVKVTALNYSAARNVPVQWVGPDLELSNAEYPGIYLSYAGMARATDREHRGRTALTYAPPGLPADVQVPQDFEDKDSTATEPWNNTFDPLTSPYVMEDSPVPYNLDFNIIVLTRNYQQMFEIIAQLDEVDRIPTRFGGLEVPEDGTVRTLDLLGGPETSLIRDEDGKRLIQSVYSVRVAAELALSDVREVQRVTQVNIEFAPPQYL